ncbi:MAG TPA: dihydroorotate dehydrogenase electron transfer subunit [Candidatus Pullichristensenella excrementigallinarum]|uniref:Dihydroorotate dehydrogenase B (NAD(+)), electron transfer subunit n=1 Tax=Candidatus Pullichristensenella excrementigallinarum TaxID=2840907 RepID=A0A9D1I9I1_9FIRM|nr:dihydroorotate dehydrogenase electron transfer subunit [Candidatus Pullichristensenella excrementigallinarum]
MQKGVFSILSNREIARDMFEMRLRGDTSALSRPGQFVNIRLEGLYLRRPISVADWTAEELLLLYKVVGAGTRKMAAMRQGETLDLLTGLGNGFDPEKCGERTLLIGGGAGVPPMIGLARKLKEMGKRPVAVLGFNAKEDVYGVERFREMEVPVHVATTDGSVGTRGLVTQVLKGLSDYDDFCACGPEKMLRAVAETCPTTGQMSFEERMGCGFGACMGCTCKTKYGNKRICKDGPVLWKEEVVW